MTDRNDNIIRTKNVGFNGVEIKIERMDSGDMEAGLRLSTIAGWNQLIADWKMFYELNPDGAFVAKYNDRVVGTVTTTDYHNLVGWIAMVLVDPEFRHRGIATELVNKALKSVSYLDTVKLDATPSGEKVYRRIGFKPEFGLKRIIGKIAYSPDPSLSTAKVHVITKNNLPSVISLDARALGVERPAVIKGLLKMAPEYALIIEDQGEVKGFLMGRHGADYEFAGPLIAKDIDTARSLLHVFAEKNAGAPAALDVPDSAAEWQAYLKEIGMEVQRPFKRMYSGRVPLSGETEFIFASGGPELG